MKRALYFLLLIGLVPTLLANQGDSDLVKKALDIHDRVEEQELVYHFGYGSNLSTKFLRKYCPNAKSVMKAYLPNYRVEFRFYSESREGGISSIIEFPGAMTHGIIYSMPKKEMDELDIIESVPEGLYTRETFLVLGEDGKWHKADLYRVADPQGSFAPAKSYLELMLEGAREHKMDPKFIKWLESMWRTAK
jgi:gamma-glutamylcyclotransferase